MSAIPSFDFQAFARELAPVVTAVGGVRAAAEKAGVSPSTVCRAQRGHPDLSHQSWMRLEALKASQQGSPA